MNGDRYEFDAGEGDGLAYLAHIQRLGDDIQRYRRMAEARMVRLENENALLKVEAEKAKEAKQP